MATTSTNMLMPIPVVGVTSPPEWATNVNQCLGIIDTHNHSAGSGVQITPDGMDINADLVFQSNNATGLRSVRFTAQDTPLAAASDLTCAYAVDDDLYFNDGQGNQIQITANGAVAGTPGSIANLVAPASASYVSASSTFVFQSDVNVAANLDGRSIKLRRSVASGAALTLSPPNSLTTNYTITLPALPASTKILSIDSSGNMAASYGVDASTIVISSNNLKVADGGITATQLASNAVTTVKILDANVTTEKLQDDTVTTVKILNNAVTTAKILNANVTTAKIADSNVTTDKIADLNVTTGKINTAAVTTAKIADVNVTAAKIETNVNLVGTNVKINSKNTVTLSTGTDSSSTQIIRGVISTLGAVVTGEGFTASKGATGSYTIFFTAPFSAAPSLIVQADSTAARAGVVSSVGTAQASVEMWTIEATAVKTDTTFHFIAIGPA